MKKNTVCCITRNEIEEIEQVLLELRGNLTEIRRDLNRLGQYFIKCHNEKKKA